MDADALTVGKELSSVGIHRKNLTVRLSKELITLLSEQLYQSPLKAIEELVVNSFDADAPNCHVVVPAAAPGTSTGRLPIIAVYDDGVGMDEGGLADLWRVGSSVKRAEQVAVMRKRRQIGKFGIGKLATYALANRITYLSSTGSDEILGLTLSFDEFRSDPTGPDKPVSLEVRSLPLRAVLSLPDIEEALNAAGLNPVEALDPKSSWTLVLLEELKDKARTISPNRLRWVLRTAMPLSAEFKLYLNEEQVTSSKLDHEIVVDFSLSELPEQRLESLRENTGQGWKIENRPVPNQTGTNAQSRAALVCELFDEGISGRAIVTRETLYGGKSADLTRSHGFFVRVRGRLIDEDDPLGGVSPRAYEVFNRFRADIDADDLDEELTAPREGYGLGERRKLLIEVLREIFNEARVRYGEWLTLQQKPQSTKREQDRNYVHPRHVERPVADFLLTAEVDDSGQGTDADESWFYLRVPKETDLGRLATELYQFGSRARYKYRFESLGSDGRMVRFNPAEREFVLNEDHALVLAYRDSPRAVDLLFDLVSAEALLEVYMRESGLPPHLAGEVLERRDSLLRSLAQEQITSASAIAASLRGSVASDHDLEIALVVAARALGFVAKHISGSDEPDGVARFRDYPTGERKIILEAKSSGKVPQLSAIDFAGLARHVKDHQAQGCLLVAPDYPGASRGDQAAAAKSAEDLRISCWTVEQVARVVEATDKRDITARNILDIVLTSFRPQAVTESVDRLLSEPRHATRELATALLEALRELDIIGPRDRVRSLDMLLVELGRGGIQAPSGDVAEALRALAAASQGALTPISDDRVRLNTSFEELERRVAPWLGNLSSARRASTFRTNDHRPENS